MSIPKLTIPQPLWKDLIKELRRRGNGCRESGAFILGARGTQLANEFICYDDLDPSCLDTGIIVFNGAGFVSLWETCLKNEKRVLADVHTHESSWVEQSFTDQTNPMIDTPGHIALILPHFAQRRKQKLKGVGLYEYEGGHKWNTIGSSSGIVRLN